VEDGDMVELDVENRRLTLHITDEEMASRFANLQSPIASLLRAAPRSGYVGLYRAHVNEASEGADLDFLVGCRGAAVPRDSH
jgi:dihydroxy-acid dehydratase